TETLKKHLPASAPDGVNELQKIAVRFEEKIYTAATNQSDYLRKISLKMLSMETKTQQAAGNAQVIPNQNNSSKPLDFLQKAVIKHSHQQFP
uniref:Mediator complex subunit 15 KIX domain-containing protein n=1 Tax=Aegilops tauschii subsp. strangulata TaxID=200361 RepID=A0A453T9L7_AEGTS